MPVTRRLSGDSDSSTASSKGGGGGGGGGGRHSLGGPSRRAGEEVVLLVNRKEGKHVIERSATGAPRARSQSRERAALAPVLKPSPTLGSPGGTRKSSTERGRSLTNEGSRRLSAPRSNSQSKLTHRAWSRDSSPGLAFSSKDPHPPSSERSEELLSRQGPSSNSVVGVGLSKKQSSSCSNSPVKGGQNSNNNSKKTTNTPRPPAPHSPSVGRGKLLPPVNPGARRSPHSSTQTSFHPSTRSPRISHTPRTAGRASHRKLSGLEQQEPEEDGLGFGLQMLPTFDPQKEQDLYRTFEAEFLANTQLARGGSAGKVSGGAKQQVLGKHSASRHSDPNVTDSAYSSSNSSTSSTTVGGKTGSLPELKESKRTNLHHFPLDDPLNLLYGHHFGGTNGNGQGELQQWGDSRGAFKKLPAISSSMEGRETPVSMPGHGDTEPDGLRNHILSQPTFHCKTMNGEHEGCATSDGKSQQAQLGWDTQTNRDVKLEIDHPNLHYEIENGGQSVKPPPPEPCSFPLHASEDCSFQDSSSENSSMGFSLSGSRSGSPPPLLPMVNGESRQKRTKGPNSKHSQGARFRPRTDNRPQNSPSRIPTPVSYRDLHSCESLSPSHSPPLSPHSSHPGGHPTTCKNLHQAFTDMIHPQSCSPALGSTDCSYTAHSGGLDTEARM